MTTIFSVGFHQCVGCKSGKRKGQLRDDSVYILVGGNGII